MASNSHDYTDHDNDQSEPSGPRMQRIKRKTGPLRGKYVKKTGPVRRGIKQRRSRRMMW